MLFDSNFIYEIHRLEVPFQLLFTIIATFEIISKVYCWLLGYQRTNSRHLFFDNPSMIKFLTFISISCKPGNGMKYMGLYKATITPYIN